MRVLVKGAGGQLGQSLRTALTDHDVSALEHADLDITRLDDVRAAVRGSRPDVIINSAAFNNVDGAESDPEAAFRLNALGPRNLALESASLKIPLVHVSTDYVFDGEGNRAYHEYDSTNPISQYGASKLAGERAVASLNGRHYIVRTAWLFHPKGKNFLKTMISLAGHPEVRVVNDQHGSPTYAPHLALAIAQLIETEAFGTYHFAGHGSTSWYDLTVALYRHLAISTPVRPVTTKEFLRPAKRPRYSALITVQEPRIVLPDWEEGVAEFARSL
jgi:dTDP-4-dehydrorhamnose reductase